MTWILIVLLTYALIGTLLLTRATQGMMISANLNEWLTLIFLWPLCIGLFAHLSMLHSTMKALEEFAIAEEAEDSEA